MVREPRKCGNSTCVGGIYICRIMCIPCVRVQKCALEGIKDMAEAVKHAMLGVKSHDEEDNDSQ